MPTATRTKPKTTPKRTPRAHKTTAPPVDDRTIIPGSISMPVADLRVILQAVLPAAASTDDTRPVLTGVHIERTDGRLSFTTTDSYRLHSVEQKASTEPVDTGTAPMRALVPAEWLGRWARAPHARLDMVTLAVDGPAGCERVTIADGYETASIPVIQGDYPKWRELVPTVDQPEAAVAFNPKYLATALKAAATFGKDGYQYPVRVTHLDPLKPAKFIVEHPDRGTLTIILMPVRVP